MSLQCERALEILKKLIGQRFYPSSWHTVDQRQINAFAEVTLDRQYIHTNPQEAELRSPYKTTIAHGYLTLSMLTYLGDQAAPPGPNPFEGVSMRINYGLNKVRFMSPVKANSQIRLQRILVSVDRKSPEILLLKFHNVIEIDGQEKPACAAETLSQVTYEGAQTQETNVYRSSA